MTSLNQEEHKSYLTKYFNNSIELKVIKHILNTKSNALHLKEKTLKEKYKELNNINYSVWHIEDKFCNEVWNFSLEHNFIPFFNQYPDITEVNELHECKYNTIIDEVMEKMNLYKENILLNLKHEISTLNNEILLIRNKNIEKDLEDSKITFHNLKSLSEEISELLRLITTSESPVNICNTIVNQNVNDCQEFMSAKKLFKKPNFRSCILSEQKNAFTSTKIIEESKENYNMENNVKFGRFIMKRQSVVSLRFERNRRTQTNQSNIHKYL